MQKYIVFYGTLSCLMERITGAPGVGINRIVYIAVIRTYSFHNSSMDNKYILLDLLLIFLRINKIKKS